MSKKQVLQILGAPPKRYKRAEMDEIDEYFSYPDIPLEMVFRCTDSGDPVGWSSTVEHPYTGSRRTYSWLTESSYFENCKASPGNQSTKRS